MVMFFQYVGNLCLMMYRADAEKEYSKTLQRIAKKARAAGKLCVG